MLGGRLAGTEKVGDAGNAGNTGENGVNQRGISENHRRGMLAFIAYGVENIL